MSFPDNFREHVIPGLRNLITAEAICIVHGVEDYSEAHRVVMRHACALGAGFLPDAIFDDLIDWVDDTLLTEILKAEGEAGAP